MSDRPIIFSGPMVRALLREIEQPGTGKTMTRRVLHPQPVGEMPKNWTAENDRSVLWAVGDRLWVRERYRAEAFIDDLPPSQIPAYARIHYEADGEAPDWAGRSRHDWFMPKRLSRITLLVTDVRVERLQEITEADAQAEGIEIDSDYGSLCANIADAGYANDLPKGSVEIAVFRDLWNSLHGPGAWDRNDWVAAITFRPVLGNIDQIGEAA